MAKRDYQKLVNDLMSDLGLKQQRFAEILGVSQASISRWRNGIHPDPKQAELLDALSQKTYAAGPHNDDGFAPTVVSIVGRVGAGAEIMPDVEQVPPEGLFEIEVDFPVRKGARAFEVDGNSMYPRFRTGDVIVCSTEAKSFEDPFGWEAAVQTADGRRFIKEIHPGSELGLYNLISHNAPPMLNIAVEWISRIDLIVPRANWRQARRPR